ncbi:hypothetical protein OFC18_30375, partial [Escherichia coli]|nr:hypothetical protein [Escherichia coli]
CNQDGWIVCIEHAYCTLVRSLLKITSYLLIRPLYYSFIWFFAFCLALTIIWLCIRNTRLGVIAGGYIRVVERIGTLWFCNRSVDQEI